MTSHHTFGPCHKCGRGGHLARECSIHVCFRCNGRGHMAWECVEGVTCSRCGEKGHLQRNCKNVSCHKCGRKGHISKFCNDPFIKAEEYERNERHQAFLKSRSTFGQGSGNLASSARAVSGSGGSQKGGPGPWDGLGDAGQDKALTEAQGLGVVIGKLGTSRSQTGILANVKVLTVKRKIYPEANMEAAKRRPLPHCVNLETDRGRITGQTSVCKDTSEAEEQLQWNGLLGYASDDSRDDCNVSIDEGRKDQGCHLDEHVQTKLESSTDERNSPAISNCVDEGFSSAIGLQLSLEHEATILDEGTTSETCLQQSVEENAEIGLQPSFDREPTRADGPNAKTDLQPSFDHEPTRADEANAETDLQPSLDHEPSRVDEESAFETGLQYGLEQVPAGVDERNA